MYRIKRMCTEKIYTAPTCKPSALVKTAIERTSRRVIGPTRVNAEIRKARFIQTPTIKALHFLQNNVRGWGGGNNGTDGSARCSSICRICFRCRAAVVAAVIVPAMSVTTEIPIAIHDKFGISPEIYSIAPFQGKAFSFSKPT